MRFIHTADVHWGMVPDSDMPWGKDRANDIRESFQKIIAKCREISADCLFISGDLFHRQPLTKDLTEMNYLFSSIPSTHVVIISGNRDRVEKNSALLSFVWSRNVTWLLSGQPESVYFDDINTEVFGFSYHSREIHDLVIDTIHPANDSHIHILLAHGGDQTHMPIDLDTLGTLPFDYIALGHLHKPVEIIERKAVYPGSPEPLDMTETGAHGYYIGDINPITHKVQRLSFETAGNVSYVPLQINVTRKTGNEELLSLIRTEIERRGIRNIYRLRIRGKHDPEAVFDLSPLESSCRIVESLDESEPEYDFPALYREHPSDMIGYYIRALQKDDAEDMSYVEKQALYYGINALLRTSRERK